MKKLSRTWIELSANNLRHNVKMIKRLAGRQAELLPVVKANGYGHGLAETVSALKGIPLWGLAVAYGEEALAVRHLGYRGRVVVLSHWSADQLPDLIHQKIELVVWDWRSWRLVQQVAGRGAKVFIHLKLDTGTSRIGFLPSEIPKLRRELLTSQAVTVGVFSHLANSEERSADRTNRQIKHFATLQQDLGLRERVVRHLACTAAAIRYPEAHFGLLRAGLGLYGLWPSDEIQTWAKAHRPWLNLKPVLSWYSRLSQVKTLPAAASIGYASTVTLKKPTVVGVVPVGYADGYDRRMSNRGWVMMNGQRCPVIGRVSMNLIMVDLSAVKRPAVGDRATLIGPGVSLNQWETSGQFRYEVVARLNAAIPRVVV